MIVITLDGGFRFLVEVLSVSLRLLIDPGSSPEAR